ncbi:MAG: hypothetical protein V2B20_08425 [Pseudomonadota bacterium]
MGGCLDQTHVDGLDGEMIIGWYVQWFVDDYFDKLEKIFLDSLRDVPSHWLVASLIYS